MRTPNELEKRKQTAVCVFRIFLVVSSVEKNVMQKKKPFGPEKHRYLCRTKHLQPYWPKSVTSMSYHMSVATYRECTATVGVLRRGGGVPEQHDRLTGRSRLVSFQVIMSATFPVSPSYFYRKPPCFIPGDYECNIPSRAKLLEIMFTPPCIGIPPHSDRVIGKPLRY